MTEPPAHYPVIPPPPTSPWTNQDPYAPYAGPAARRPDPSEPTGDGQAPEPALPYEPYAGGPTREPLPPYEPYAGGPAAEPAAPREPYAGGPGHTGPGGRQYWTPPGTGRPPAYWPLSIVGALFSLLIGAIAIYFSVQVGRRWDRGDVEGAQRASRTARILGTVAVVVGVIGTAIIIGTDSR